jgi:hypothetical protein
MAGKSKPKKPENEGIIINILTLKLPPRGADKSLYLQVNYGIKKLVYTPFPISCGRSYIAWLSGLAIL